MFSLVPIYGVDEIHATDENVYETIIHYVPLENVYANLLDYEVTNISWPNFAHVYSTQKGDKFHCLVISAITKKCLGEATVSDPRKWASNLLKQQKLTAQEFINSDFAERYKEAIEESALIEKDGYVIKLYNQIEQFVEDYDETIEEINLLYFHYLWYKIDPTNCHLGDLNLNGLWKTYNNLVEDYDRDEYLRINISIETLISED